MLVTTISKQEYETQSDFRTVPDDPILFLANQLTVFQILPISTPKILHSEPEGVRLVVFPSTGEMDVLVALPR